MRSRVPPRPPEPHRGVKKRKVRLTFKQKRRRAAKLQKGIAHAEVKGTKRSKASQSTERKTQLKKLW